MQGLRTEIAQAVVAFPDVIAEQFHGCQHEGEGSQTEANNKSNSYIIQVANRFRSGRYKKGQPSIDVCIYRVPTVFMDGNRKGYVPEYVSLGPFHHNKHKKRSAMEDHKLEAVYRTLKRLKDNKSIKDLITEVQNLDKKIRDCYEDRAIKYDRGTLACMMTMDACFILEFFRAFTKGGEQFSLVFRGRDNSVLEGILMDILKLENQIPLFLLIRILELEFQTTEEAESELYEMLYKSHVFEGHPFCKKLKVQEKHITEGACHLLDLYGKVTSDFLMKSNPDSDTTAEDEVYTPNAELLHKAGIQFKPSDEGKVELGKSSFAGCTLFLPSIVVDDQTETVLRNLIAFEECHQSDKPKTLSYYICLMDDLINSEKDVALLINDEIIKNCIGSDHVVAKMFNSLNHGITFVEQTNLLTKVRKDIRKEYKKRRSGLTYRIINRLKQYLEEYPWYFISIVAGILIFGMTAVQTVNSFKHN